MIVSYKIICWILVLILDNSYRFIKDLLRLITPLFNLISLNVYIVCCSETFLWYCPALSGAVQCTIRSNLHFGDMEKIQNILISVSAKYLPIFIEAASSR